MLIKLMASPSTRVTIPCLSLVGGLLQEMETRKVLLENGIGLKVEEMERLGTDHFDFSDNAGLNEVQQTSNLYRVIKSNLKKHDAEMKKIEQEKLEQKAYEAQTLEQTRKAQALIDQQAKLRAEEAAAVKSKTVLRSWHFKLIYDSIT